MWFAGKRQRQHHGIGLLAAALLALASSMQLALAQTAAPAPPAPAPPAPAQSLVDQLVGSESSADIDLTALRQQAADRIQSRADAVAAKRPPIAPQLLKLPQFDFNAVFDPDSSTIRPQSYQAIGRIADALSSPKLLPYAFLVINHTVATGARAPNLALSQRRAEAIRLALAVSFKISPRRLHALGLGEEQLQDSSRPASEANNRAQIVTIGLVPAVVPTQPAAGSGPAAKKGPAAKTRKRQ